MYKLADMIEKNDDSLSFANNTNKRNTGRGLLQKKKQNFDTGGSVANNNIKATWSLHKPEQSYLEAIKNKNTDFVDDNNFQTVEDLTRLYADKKITQEDIIKFCENTGRTGDALEMIKYEMNPKNKDSSISQELGLLEKEKEAENQYRALIKRLKKDHNVTVQDYEFGNPKNKRQKITDYIFQVGGETPRANVGMARPFIDPSGEAIINMPVSLPYSKKLRVLNEELFHVGQYRDEAITGKPIDRLRNVKYLLPAGLGSLIPSDPNVKFLSKSGREALEDFIGYKLGTRPTQYGRYSDPEATEGIHRSYQQSEDYLKQFGLSTTDPESFTYRDPKSERFFENPRKQYAGFANGGDININDLPKVDPIPDVGSITPNTNNNLNIGNIGAGLALSQFLPTSTALNLANKINLTPAQMAYLASMFAPGSGVIDASGQFPSFPGRDVPLEQAFAGEPMPSIKENIAAGGIDRYLFAPLQGLGVLSDAAYGIPVAGPLIASGLKTPLVLASMVSGIAKAGKSSKSLPIQKEMFRIQGDVQNKLNPMLKYDLEGIPINYEKLTEGQKKRRGYSYEQKYNQIALNVDEIDEIADWVSGDLSKKNKSQEYLEDINPFIENLEKTGLTSNSQAFLRQFADKNGNIKVYRYLSIGEGGGKKLMPEKGIVSTTINPNHAVEQGLIEKTKNITVATKDYVQPDMMADPFEKQIAFEKALKEGTLKRKKLIRDTYILEYDIPVEKVKGYMPAVYASIPERAKDNYVRNMAENNYEVDQMMEELAEYSDVDIEDIARDDAIDEVIRRYQLREDLDYSIHAPDEFEVIANLKNVKPTATYKVSDENTIEAVKGLKEGGEVSSISNVGSITPIPPSEMREAFGGPFYQMMNPSAQRMVDAMGLRGAGIKGLVSEAVGPGGKFKLSKAAMAKIKPLLQQRKREIDLAQNIDPVERAAAQNRVKQIEKQIDKIIADDQS